MTLVSLEGKPVFANKKLTEILGYSEEELSQMNVTDFTYPEDIDLKEFRRLINREIDSFNIEKRYIRKDGAIIWGDLNASLLVDNDDNIINVIAAVSDITDKKENEIKLFEHSQIIDQVVEAIISIDEDARINYWNKGAQSLFGYYNNEIIGENVARLYAHEHTEEFLKNILEVLKRENSTTYEQQMIKKEGDVFYAKITVSNKYNNSGVNVGRLVSITDMSREKDSELKLLSLNHDLKDHVLFLNNIMDFSPSAMWIANPEGTVIRTNQSLRNILQLKDEQILDKYNVLKDQNLIDQGVMPLVEKVFSEHSVARFEIKWVESETGIDSFNKGKKYFLDLTIFPIVNEKGVLQNVVCQWVDVTDRKSAEEEIILQRNKLSKILTVAPVGIGQTINRIFTEVNLVFCEILGYSREELIGKSSRYIYPSQEEFENVGEKKSAQIEKYGTGRLETFFKTKDGRILNIILASTPVDKLDLSKGSIFTVLDITEQKKAEKEVEKYQHHLEKLVKQRTEALESSNVRLKENQYRLDAAFTTSGYAWWDYRVKEGRLITHSAIFEALGYVQDEDDTPIFWWSRQLHPDDKKIIRDIIQRIDEGADTFDCEIRLKHRNGNYQWFKERGSVITRDKASCPLRFIGTSEDITDKKKTEFDLLKLSQAVEQSPVVVVITNNKAKIEYVNPAFETLAGYTPEEIIGQNPRILNARVLPPSVYKNLWKTILSGKTWIGELCNRTKDGEIFWENAIITPVIDDYGEIVNFIAVKENITERKKFIEELEKAKHEAESGNRAKSEFLANMSHEIRTPMNAVIGFTDILSHKLTNPLHLKHLDSIKTSSKNLLTIINDILDVSKIEAGKFEIQESEINLITLLEELEVVFGAQAKENNLQFETIIGEIDSVIILSDEVRIRQILYNLISNALKFTAKGFVRITLEQDQSLQIPKGSEQLKFIVEDTGIGIRRELQDSVFESFVQQEGQDYKTFGGTGLGLTISKKLAHLLGGDILLQSEEGKGSKFTFVLDHVKYLGTGESHIEYHKNQDVKFEEQKVLVIDDIESNRLYMQNALHDLGLIVVCVNNGLQGLIALDEYHIDLIITDIKMPELDGYGFITKLREGKHSDIPCVAYTASALENEINTIKKYDFNAVLLKPVQLENLINLLMQYIPYQLIEKKEEIKKDKLVSTLTKEEKNRIRVDLESFIEPLYYKLKDQQSFEDLNELCGILNRIGMEQNVPLFCYYSEQLTVAIDSFDIETIIGLVKSFGKIINPNK